jgi:hypothetical protein
MNEVERLLERQALWQQSRRTLPWPEKIRLAERMRPTVEAFRLQREQRRASCIPGETSTPPAVNRGLETPRTCLSCLPRLP